MATPKSLCFIVSLTGCNWGQKEPKFSDTPLSKARTRAPSPRQYQCWRKTLRYAFGKKRRNINNKLRKCIFWYPWFFLCLHLHFFAVLGRNTSTPSNCFYQWYLSQVRPEKSWCTDVDPFFVCGKSHPMALVDPNMDPWQTIFTRFWIPLDTLQRTSDPPIGIPPNHPF